MEYQKLFRQIQTRKEGEKEKKKDKRTKRKKEIPLKTFWEAEKN